MGLDHARLGEHPTSEGRISEAQSALDRAAEVLRDGTHVVILPEGHRTRTGRLGPLKKGAFYLALATEADICPFVLQGLYEFKNTHSWRLHPRSFASFSESRSPGSRTPEIPPESSESESGKPSRSWTRREFPSPTQDTRCTMHP